MDKETKIKLLAAWQYCDDEDKSTEFMLQFMQDVSGLDSDEVLEFIEGTEDEEREVFALGQAHERDFLLYIMKELSELNFGEGVSYNLSMLRPKIEKRIKYLEEYEA